MKLLEKSQVNNLKQNEQKAIIDSGVSLARKIDVLRVELLDMEKKRSDFINGSRAELESAIGGLRATKNDLDSEISEQRKLLEKLREPLDEEWNKVREQAEQLTVLQAESEEYFKSLILERGLLLEEKKLVDAQNNTAWNNQYETEKLLEQAKNDRIQTKKILDAAQASKDRYDVKHYNEELRLSAWDKKLADKEKNLKSEQIAFNKEKKELETKKKRWKI